MEDGHFYFVLTKRLHGERIKAAAAYEGDYKDKARFIGEIIGQLSLALAKVDAVVKDVNLYHDVKNWAYPKVKDMLHIPERFGKMRWNPLEGCTARSPNKSSIVTPIQATLFWQKTHGGLSTLIYPSGIFAFLTPAMRQRPF